MSNKMNEEMMNEELDMTDEVVSLEQEMADLENELHEIEDMIRNIEGNMSLSQETKDQLIEAMSYVAGDINEELESMSLELDEMVDEDEEEL